MGRHGSAFPSNALDSHLRPREGVGLRGSELLAKVVQSGRLWSFQGPSPSRVAGLGVPGGGPLAFVAQKL
jgi:hypothetical protein